MISSAIQGRFLLFTTLVGGTCTSEDNFDDKIVILVDDGAATGATVIAAARSIRKRFRPRRLIIALPVAPKETVRLLKQEADLVEVVIRPSNYFHAVGQYYQDFNPVEDEQVKETNYSFYSYSYIKKPVKICQDLSGDIVFMPHTN